MAVAQINGMPIKTSMDNSSCLEVLSDPDEATTDAGDSHSETEASVAVSASDCESDKHGSRNARRCRFGTTPLETIPATPVAAAMRSPPGLSRAAMCQARDQCRVSRKPASEQEFDSTGERVKSSRQCRFGSSQLGTVPRTPDRLGSWKSALATAIGSPPGLSRASMRRERDARKEEPLSATSWGSRALLTREVTCTPHSWRSRPREGTALTLDPCGTAMTPPAMRAVKKRAAREALLLRTKQEAALLQAQAKQMCEDAKAETHAAPTLLDDNDLTTDVGHSSSEEEGSAASFVCEGQHCRFAEASLRTVPVVSAAASPPGFSRAALRQARDACKVDAMKPASWGSHGAQPAACAPQMPR